MFETVNKYVTDTAEQMIKVVEEGTSILMGIQEEGGGSGGGIKQAPADEIFNDPIDDIEMTIDEEDMMGASMNSPLDGIAEGVLDDIMKNQAGPASTSDNFNAFRSAIAWNEPFIMGIVIFQIFLLITTVTVTRRCGMGSGMILLAFMGCTVRSAEYLNSYGSKNWEQFATQNYFDDRGIFISIMLSGPMIIMAFIMLISYVREASGLLVKVKRHELAHKKRSSNKSQGKGAKDNKKNAKKSNKKQD